MPSRSGTKAVGLVAALVVDDERRLLDVVTDGEFSKPSFITYVVDRLGGFEPNPAVVQMKPWDNTKEARAFPDFYAGPPHVSSDAMRRSICTGPITSFSLPATSFPLLRLTRLSQPSLPRAPSSGTRKSRSRRVAKRMSERMRDTRK